jgi:hypothetical protein
MKDLHGVDRVACREDECKCYEFKPDKTGLKCSRGGCLHDAGDHERHEPTQGKLHSCWLEVIEQVVVCVSVCVCGVLIASAKSSVSEHRCTVWCIDWRMVRVALFDQCVE